MKHGKIEQIGSHRKQCRGMYDLLQEYVWAEDSPIKRVVYAGHVYRIGTRWADDFNIATGLMLTADHMEALGLNMAEYPRATYLDPATGETTTYYILETGHDYHIVESGNLGYEFDFESPVFHPMLVNGDLKNIVFEDEINMDEPLSLSRIRLPTLLPHLVVLVNCWLRIRCVAISMWRRSSWTRMA